MSERSIRTVVLAWTAAWSIAAVIAARCSRTPMCPTCRIRSGGGPFYLLQRRVRLTMLILAPVIGVPRLTACIAGVAAGALSGFLTWRCAYCG